MKSIKFADIEICYIAPYKEIKAKPIRGNYYKLLVSCSGMLTFALNQMKTYAEGPLTKIKDAESTLLDYGQGVGRIVCIVMCVFEIIKSVKDGDVNAFWGIILKYLLAYGSLHILPWAFDLIAGFFGG